MEQRAPWLTASALQTPVRPAVRRPWLLSRQRPCLAKHLSLSLDPCALRTPLARSCRTRRLTRATGGCVSCNAPLRSCARRRALARLPARRAMQRGAMHFLDAAAAALFGLRLHSAAANCCLRVAHVALTLLAAVLRPQVRSARDVEKDLLRSVSITEADELRPVRPILSSDELTGACCQATAGALLSLVRSQARMRRWISPRLRACWHRPASAARPR